MLLALCIIAPVEAEICQAAVFQRDIVVVVQGVDARHFVSVAHKVCRKIVADEAGHARYQNLHRKIIHTVGCPS